MTGRGRKPATGEAVLDRAVCVLDAFDASGEGFSLAELGRRSQLPISVVAPPPALAPETVRTAVVAIAGAISRRLGAPGMRQVRNELRRSTHD
jgi:hypothetical protein